MSTRCQIGVYPKVNSDIQKDKEVLIYRHTDGYPESMVPDLLPILKMFHARRGLGEDTSYATAWIVHGLIELHVNQMKAYAERDGINNSYSPADGKNCLSHGVDTEFHGDIEYFYAVHPDRLDVYETNGDTFNLLESHKIEKEPITKSCSV